MTTYSASAARTGRTLRATKPDNHAAKVTPEDVREIRYWAGRGLSVGELVIMFPKLKYSAIYSIVERTSWRHVK